MRISIPSILIMAALLLGAGCASFPEVDHDLNDLIEAYQEHSRRLEERQRAWLERGIKSLEVTTRPDGRRVSAHLAGARLDVVVDRILERAHLGLVLDGVNLSGRITARFEDYELLGALNFLLRRSGLEARLENGVVTVLQAPVEVRWTGGAGDEDEEEGEARGPKVAVEAPLRFIETESALSVLEQMYPMDEDAGTRAVSFAARAETNSIILRGRRRDVSQALELLGMLDFDQGHVLLEVLYVQIDTEALLQTGSKLMDGAKGQFSDIGIDFGDLAGNTISFTHLADAAHTKTFTAVINLLIQDDNAHILARPYLSTRSGSSASLQSVEDRFVVAQLPGGEEVTLEEISSGITLEILPTIQVDGSIHMRIKAGNSSFIPSLENVSMSRTRSDVEASVVVGDGETVIIGGLMVNASSRSKAGVPGLRDAPVLNFLFGHRSRAQRTIQALLYVTPHLWEPGMRLPLEGVGALAPGPPLRDE